MTDRHKSADDKAARFAEAAVEETQRRLEVARGQIDRLQKALDASEAERDEWKAEAESRMQAAVSMVKEARAERDRYSDALVARHGGEPVALLTELDATRAEVERLRQAVGLMSTAKPDMEMDADDPVAMAAKVVAEVERLREELAAVQERVDLDVDEFRRIKAELDNLRIGVPPKDAEGAKILYALVSGLCDRAVTAGRQRVPLIEQRDRAEAEVDRLHAELAKAQHTTSGCCPQSEELAREVERLTETLDDWRRSATLAAEETCGDEKHCTCVGVLRKVLHEARAEVERLRAELAKAQHTTSGCCPQSEELAREVKRLRAERDRYHDALVARHGGEPVALLAELDATRAEAERLCKQLDEAVALLQRAKGRLGAWFGLGIDALLRAVREEDKP